MKYIVTRTKAGIYGEIGKRDIEIYVYANQIKAQEKIRLFVAELAMNEKLDYIAYDSAKDTAVATGDCYVWVFGYKEVGEEIEED